MIMMEVKSNKDTFTNTLKCQKTKLLWPGKIFTSELGVKERPHKLQKVRENLS